MYGLWIEGKSKKLAQVLSRALDDQVREEWQAITSEINNWEQADMKTIFIQLLQQLGTQVFGPKAFKTQCRAMEKGDIKIPESDLRAGTHRLFQINRMLPYLGTYAEEYLLSELNKIIVKSLPMLAQRKYLEEGGDDLEDQADILEMMTQLDKKFRLKKEFAELEKKSNNNNNNNNNRKSNQSSNNGNNKGGNNGSGKKPASNPCRKHDGAHEWKDCPDYKPFDKSKSKDATAKSDKKPKGDLHSAQAAPAKKATPIVRFGKVPTKETESALEDDSDDESAMMVQAVGEHTPPLLNSITVIDVPSQNGDRYGTTMLIDNGYTDYLIMSYSFAKSLGYEIQEVPGRSYNTTNGLMVTNLQVSINDLRLPHLSRNRAFSATIKVAPENSGDFGYGMIMGCRQMDLLGIDTSRTDKTITWGADVSVPMVSTSYWTDARIQSLLWKTSEPPSAEMTAETLNEDIYDIFTNADVAPTFSQSMRN